MESEQLRTEILILRNRLENAKYEADSALEDKIDELESEVRTLKASLDARVMNFGFGDVICIDTQNIDNLMNKNLLIKLAREYGCNFVTAPGLDELRKLDDIELEKMNLKKIVPGERPTGLQKLEAILVDVKVSKSRGGLPYREQRILGDMEALLQSTIQCFKNFEDMVNERLRQESGGKDVVGTGCKILCDKDSSEKV